MFRKKLAKTSLVNNFSKLVYEEKRRASEVYGVGLYRFFLFQQLHRV